MALNQCERTRTSKSPPENCPFCNANLSLDKISKHVSHHLIDYALFSLPILDMEEDGLSKINQSQSKFEGTLPQGSTSVVARESHPPVAVRSAGHSTSAGDSHERVDADGYKDTGTSRPLLLSESSLLDIMSVFPAQEMQEYVHVWRERLGKYLGQPSQKYFGVRCRILLRFE